MTGQAEREGIIEAARAFAQEAGQDVDRYEVAGVETEETAHFVLFRGVSGLPGDHFTVELDGATGAGVRLIPGR
jgi:hypothetical protein